ncbi:accessory Sec system protein translocase subunit SecY2 [Ligilactobacillus salivarius]|uniref:accessory Sec system protein translocase subunit SecY2 n=1 Tax=Ligilactobacillus salivarius TaxID=1624 RepID=UPI0025A397DF|nr:accessory Sec system protein translocase subunit SecY2 [Ligilactobacillus salivarius]MDM8283854.1 accessory Sec system protein translocase subunit SecY2 [Ligilactobacillus salivarius]
MRLRKKPKKDTLINFFVPKFLWTMFILITYMIGSAIPIPLGGTMAEAKSNYVLQLASNATGGDISNLTLLSLGLGPWMSSMIIWQVLVMIKPLGLGSLSERESGYLRNILILFLSIVQSIGIVLSFKMNVDYETKVGVVIMLIAGGFLTVWLAYLNAAKGVGGSMLIMLFKMITGVEQQLGETFKMLSKISNGKWIMVLVALAILILVIMSVIMERSEYRIPVTRVMINNDLNKDSYIPIKVNNGGGMAIMFAMSLFMIVNYLLQIIAHHFPVGFLKTFAKGVSMYSFAGATLYVIVLFALAIMFGFVNIDAGQIAEGLRNSGDYIKNVKPGKDTKRYLTKYVAFFSIVGSIYITLVAGGPLYIGAIQPKYAKVVMIPGIAMMCFGMIFNVQEQIRAAKSLYSYKKWIK